MLNPHVELLCDHASWAEVFEREAKSLGTIFGSQLVAIEHIGSTAIPGLVAKPIVDIAVLIREKAAANAFVPAIERAGYELVSVSSERHFFVKSARPMLHLSVAYADFSRFFERQVRFRDYLRGNADARRQYAALKKRLLVDDPTGEHTSEGKTDFIVKVLTESGFDWSEGW